MARNRWSARGAGGPVLRVALPSRRRASRGRSPPYASAGTPRPVRRAQRAAALTIPGRRCRPDRPFRAGYGLQSAATIVNMYGAKAGHRCERAETAHGVIASVHPIVVLLDAIGIDPLSWGDSIGLTMSQLPHKYRAACYQANDHVRSLRDAPLLGVPDGTVKLSLLGADGGPKVGNELRIGDRIRPLQALDTV